MVCLEVTKHLLGKVDRLQLEATSVFDVDRLSKHLEHRRSKPSSGRSDQTVCFKLDFLAWLASLTQRDWSIVADLMVGERTRDVANKYSISPARISQKRREYCRDWHVFLGDGVPTSVPNRSGVA